MKLYENLETSNTFTNVFEVFLKISESITFVIFIHLIFLDKLVPSLQDGGAVYP